MNVAQTIVMTPQASTIALLSDSAEPQQFRFGDKRNSLVVLSEEEVSFPATAGETVDEPVVEVVPDRKLDSEKQAWKKTLTINTEDSSPGGGTDYKEKIKEFIAMEKLKLLFRAIQSGLPEKKVQEFLETETLADFDLQNFKSRF